MMNAKAELIHIIAGRKIKCASLTFKKRVTTLKVTHTADQEEQFLAALDFEYDDTYGNQELAGTVWLTDGSWLSRENFSGMEWWEHHELPAIPEELL